MADVITLISAVNPDLLYAQLAAGGFPGMTSIMSPSADPVLPVQVTMHFADDAQQSSIDTAIALIHAHDATQLSAAQQAAVAAQQQQSTLKTAVGAIIGELQSFNVASITDVASAAAAIGKLVTDLIPLVQAVDTFL